MALAEHLPIRARFGNLPLSWEKRLVCLEMQPSRGLDLHRGLAILTVGRRRRLCVLDGANRFDPYPFAALARRVGGDARMPLDAVRVSRAFTIHQLREAVERLLPPLLEARPLPLVVVLGLDHLFLEESLPMWERRHVLGAILRCLGVLRDGGLPVLATHEPVGAGDGWWLPMLRAAADDVGTLEEREGRLQLTWAK